MIYFIHSVGAGELFDIVMVSEGCTWSEKKKKTFRKKEKKGALKLFSLAKVKIIIQEEKTPAP